MTKYVVYNVREYFKTQPSDMQKCPICQNSLSISEIAQSEAVTDHLEHFMERFTMYDFTRLYECLVCHWWAVRESFSLCEYGWDLDYLVVCTDDPAERANQQPEPWKQILQNINIYGYPEPLPDELGKLFGKA